MHIHSLVNNAVTATATTVGNTFSIENVSLLSLLVSGG